MAGIAIISYALSSVYMGQSSTLGKVIGAFIKLVSSVVNQFYPLPGLWRGKLLLTGFSPKCPLILHVISFEWATKL